MTFKVVYFPSPLYKIDNVFLNWIFSSVWVPVGKCGSNIDIYQGLYLRHSPTATVTGHQEHPLHLIKELKNKSIHFHIKASTVVCPQLQNLTGWTCLLARCSEFIFFQEAFTQGLCSCLFEKLFLIEVLDVWWEISVNKSLPFKLSWIELVLLFNYFT